MEKLKKKEIINRYNELLEKFKQKCGAEFGENFNNRYKITDNLCCVVNHDGEFVIAEYAIFRMIEVYNDDMTPWCFEFHKIEEIDGEIKITEKYMQCGLRIDDEE